MYKAPWWAQRERKLSSAAERPFPKGLPSLECELTHEMAYLHIVDVTKTNRKYQLDSFPIGDVSAAIKPNYLILG